MDEIVKSSPASITAEEARADVVAAREQLARKLEAVRQSIAPYSKWRGVVKAHPVASIGAAFLVGFALSQIFSRK